MNLRNLTSTLLLLILPVWASAATVRKVTSPDGKLQVRINVGTGISYSVFDGDKMLQKDNKAGMTIDGTDVTKNATIRNQQKKHIKENVQAPFYRNPQFAVEYNSLRMQLSTGVSLEFRVFNDGVAYRFATTAHKGEGVVNAETAEFNFTESHVSYLPYSTNQKKPMAMAFQATYNKAPLDKQPTDNLAFLPATVDCQSAKLSILESDLESYPGMFIRPEGKSLKATFAPRPKSFDYYPWRVQKYVTETESFLATFNGDRTFPWRILAIARTDTEMPVNNLVYALASPNRIGDTSWIKPGLVSWDWWNDWGLSGVDFKAGINQQTYKYYIDFAAKNKIPYVVLDEGWYTPKSGDMLTVIDDINLPELVAYAKKKDVKLILWTVFNVLDKQLEAACKTYSDMGIAGFKVDFLDRDDQEAVEMIYRIAEACAKHHLVLDYHGIYKPTGINRTYPNIINFESCFGMEEAKWTKHDEKDMPEYDVTVPYIRMQQGFMDFTPGGMRNATKADFQPVYYNPMTMGTRCHQLAMYIVQDSPLTMLADAPTEYEKEEEFTRIIASLPTVFDKTIIPQGKLGKYIVTARKQGLDWYVGAQTNWNERDITISFGFLDKDKTYEATIVCDGINANKHASDYRIMKKDITASSTLDIHLAEGGGCLVKLHLK